jgi:hypothetical protein
MDHIPHHKSFKLTPDTPIRFIPSFLQRYDKDKEEMKERFMHASKHIYFADFETDTLGEFHEPYMVCLKNASANLNTSWIGPDCAEKLLQFLHSGATVYFHNLKYDFNFLAKYGVDHILQKGNRNLCSRIKYQGKIIDFKDSLAMITCALAQFPESIGLKNIKKEKFPYNYYSSKYGFSTSGGMLTKETIGKISEAGKYEKEPWGENDYEGFIQNIDSIHNYRVGDDEFNMCKYSEFYCMQDVEILRK